MEQTQFTYFINLITITMKRFFRNLKTLALVALVGVATLATSCNQDDLDQIKSDLSDLTERVAELEQKLNDEVAALKALIDNKVAIVACEQDDAGNWIVTLADGTEVNISGVGQSDLTVVKEDGVYYWAQVVDGNVVAMVDANGNKIAVVDDAQVRQDAEGNTEVSLDGGETWVKLAKEATSLFSDVVVEDGKVTFVLAGGESFTVALPEEFKFAVSGNAAFFRGGETKTFKVEAQAISDAVLLSTPKGWAVEYTGDALTVTAPTEEAVAAGEADEKATIKVLGVSAGNHAVIGKLTVKLGVDFEISIEERTYSYMNYETWEMVTETGLCVVIRNYAYLGPDRWGDEKWANMYYGIMPKGAMTPEQIVDMCVNYNYEYGYYSSDFMGYPETVVDGVAEIVEPISQFVEDCSGYDENWEKAKAEIGMQYEIWAGIYEVDEDYNQYFYSTNIVMTDYIHAGYEIEQVGESTPLDVQIAVGIAGYDGYSIYLGEKDAWKEEFEAWKQSLEGGWGEPYLGWLGTETRFEGSLFEFGADPDAYDPMVVKPGTTYDLAILILDNDKQPEEYTLEDVKVTSFTTAPAGSGSAVKPTMTLSDVGMTYADVTITTENAYATYYKLYLEKPENLTVEQLLADGKGSTDPDNYVGNYSLTAGQKFWVAAVALDNEGNFGEVVVTEFAAKDIEYSEDLTVNIGEVTNSENGKIVYVPVTCAGDVYRYKYAYISDSEWTSTWGGSLEAAEAKLAAAQYMYSIGDWPQFAYVDEMTDNTIVIDGYSAPQQKAHILVIALDEDNNQSHAAYVEYTPTGEAMQLIYDDEEGWEFGKPTVAYQGLIDGFDSLGYEEKQVAFDVTFAEGTAEVYVWITNTDYLSSHTPYTLVDGMVSGEVYGVNVLTESGVAARYYTYCRDYRDDYDPSWNSDGMVVIAWKDTNNKYHQAWYNREVAEAAQDDIEAQYALENSGDNGGIMPF